MKCVVCDKVKGKRFCPAKNGDICPSCCGQKRVVEIACPPDCQYLKSGHGYQAAKKFMAEWQATDDPRKGARLYATAQKHWQIIGEIEQVIIRYAQGLRSFSDERIRDAVSLVRDTYSTEQKGIIYEHTSADPLVQPLVRELRAALEQHRQVANDRPILKTAEVLDCLEVVFTDIAYHIAKPSEVGSYLVFIRKSHPEVATAPRSQSIIYP